MRTNWKKGQTTGFRTAALFAVLGATLVWFQPEAEACAAPESVPLDEVVLVTKVSHKPQPLAAGGALGLLGGLLGGGGAGGSSGSGGSLLGGLLGFSGT